RLEPLDRALVAAGHQAEPGLQAPDAAGHAHVDERDLLLARLPVPALRVAEVGVAAVDDRVTGLEQANQLLEGLFGDLAGRDHQPDVARRRELLGERAERLRRRRDLRVVRLDLVPVLLEPLRHAAAHPPEPDHPKLHQTSSNRMRTTRRPRSASVSKSPIACARMSLPNANGLPGIGSSSPVASTTWRKLPVFGPPLCSCPVECWYRGPKPCVTTQPVAARARSASATSFASFSSVGFTNPRIAT